MRGGRVTNADTEKKLQFAFLQVPDSPVEPIAGNASVSGNEARAPWFDLRNRSGNVVNHVEMGWIIRDEKGREAVLGKRQPYHIMPSDFFENAHKARELFAKIIHLPLLLLCALCA